MTDEDIWSIIETGLTKADADDLIEKFKQLHPKDQFPILILSAKQGYQAALSMVREICLRLCKSAPSDDMIWIAERMIELGEIVRGRDK